tara:strand:+ start:199 stop:435 length:237 start_codon:yes stop_codon:yes gene_type:complete
LTRLDNRNNTTQGTQPKMQTALEFLEWYESVVNISESEPNTLTDENISEALSMLPESEQEKLREITRYSSNLKGLEDI